MVTHYVEDYEQVTGSKPDAPEPAPAEDGQVTAKVVDKPDKPAPVKSSKAQTK